MTGHGREDHQTLAVHSHDLPAGTHAGHFRVSGLAEGMMGGQQPAYDSARAATAAADLETVLHWTEVLLADPDIAADAAAAAAVATCNTVQTQNIFAKFLQEHDIAKQPGVWPCVLYRALEENCDTMSPPSYASEAYKMQLMSEHLSSAIWLAP